MTTDKYIEELKASLLPISRQREILWYLLTNATELSPVNSHTAMKTIMPNAVFIGFTGYSVT